MLVTVEPHPDPAWTRSASLGMESQLTKVANALARDVLARGGGCPRAEGAVSTSSRRGSRCRGTGHLGAAPATPEGSFLGYAPCPRRLCHARGFRHPMKDNAITLIQVKVKPSSRISALEPVGGRHLARPAQVATG